MSLALQTVLLAAHLLAMNVAAAGPLVAILVEAFAQHSRQPAAARIGQRLTVVSLAAFFGGTILGVLNGCWLWMAGGLAYFAALGRMPSKVYFGMWELVFYVFCMAVYIAWWRWAPPRRVWERVIHAQFALAASTNLLWHFPPLMILTNHLAQNSPTGEVIHAAAFRELIFAPHIFSRCVHVWLASLASAGIVLAWISSGRPKADSSPTPEQQQALARLAHAGVCLALVASVLQLPVGVWVLFSSPGSEQNQLLGGNLLATGLLAVSVLISLGMMHRLANLALGPTDRRGIATSAILLCATVLFMSATLRLSRSEGGARRVFQPRSQALVTSPSVLSSPMPILR
jgi:hypothetical protein